MNAKMEEEEEESVISSSWMKNGPRPNCNDNELSFIQIQVSLSLSMFVTPRKQNFVLHSWTREAAAKTSIFRRESVLCMCVAVAR